jgi:hypothetical protein
MFNKMALVDQALVELDELLAMIVDRIEALENGNG